MMGLREKEKKRRKIVTLPLPPQNSNVYPKYCPGLLSALEKKMTGDFIQAEKIPGPVVSAGDTSRI